MKYIVDKAVCVFTLKITNKRECSKQTTTNKNRKNIPNKMPAAEENCFVYLLCA